MTEAHEQTVGEILRNCREEKKVSLEEASSVTNISKKHLIALEKNDFDALPGKIHITGFIRLYGGFLGLSESLLMDAYHKQQIMESQPPLEEIMELSRSFKSVKKRKINPFMYVIVAFVFCLATVLTLYLSSSKSQTTQKKVAKNTAKTNGFWGKTFTLKEGEFINIPFSNKMFRFKLARVEKALVNFLPEEKEGSFILGLKSILIYDVDSNGVYDFTLKLSKINFKNKEVSVVFNPLKLALKDPKAFYMITSQEELSKMLSSKNLAKEEGQKTESKGGDFPLELKNNAKFTALMWVVSKGKGPLETEYLKLAPGKSLRLKLIEKGQLKIKELEVADLSTVSLQIGAKTISYPHLSGKSGYISFRIQQDQNGEESLVHTAVY